MKLYIDDKIFYYRGIFRKKYSYKIENIDRIMRKSKNRTIEIITTDKKHFFITDLDRNFWELDEFLFQRHLIP